MSTTYFKVKPESALYKNYFIEDAERKKLNKLTGDFMKNHFAGGTHEVWTALYPFLIMTLSTKEAEDFSHQLCKGLFGDNPHVCKGVNGDQFYRFKGNSKTYNLWKKEVMSHIDEEKLRANALWQAQFPGYFYTDMSLQATANGGLFGTHSNGILDNLKFPDSVTVISEEKYRKALQ